MDPPRGRPRDRPCDRPRDRIEGVGVERGLRVDAREERERERLHPLKVRGEDSSTPPAYYRLMPTRDESSHF